MIQNICVFFLMVSCFFSLSYLLGQLLDWSLETQTVWCRRWLQGAEFHGFLVQNAANSADPVAKTCGARGSYSDWDSKQNGRWGSHMSRSCCLEAPELFMSWLKFQSLTNKKQRSTMIDLTHAMKTSGTTGMVCGNPIIKQPEKSAGHGWSWQDFFQVFRLSADSKVLDRLHSVRSHSDGSARRSSGAGCWGAKIWGCQMVKKTALISLIWRSGKRCQTIQLRSIEINWVWLFNSKTQYCEAIEQEVFSQLSCSIGILSSALMEGSPMCMEGEVSKSWISLSRISWMPTVSTEV